MSSERPSAAELRLARRARFVALVMVAAMLLWMRAQLLGGRLGLPAGWAFAFDIAALAAFLWALVMTYQIWRSRRNA